jgi:hypothetical protein
MNCISHEADLVIELDARLSSGLVKAEQEAVDSAAVISVEDNEFCFPRIGCVIYS